jgi:hypothetical protein
MSGFIATDNPGNHFITREHPEYRVQSQTRAMYRDLYAGGAQFKVNAANYLIRRHKEPNDIYFERLSRVFYENYIGSIVDWYTATLFRREPVIQFQGDNTAGKDFFCEFIEDCDRGRTTLSAFFRRQITEALVFGRAYTAIDFPQSSGPAVSRAHEDAEGLSRAYLVDYSAADLINWSYDDNGVFEWVVLRTSAFRQASVHDGNWNRQTRWLYYDREHFELYVGEDEQGRPSAPLLAASGRHALAEQKRVPLFEMRISEGLWLMNKASLLQLEHFNKSNALAWALTMGLFATPVVYSDREFAQITGESYFIQLGPQDKFGWTEPEGKVFQIAADNLVRLQDEVYRVCYMNSQMTGQKSGTQQSGLSKAWDFTVTEEILRAYGDAVKEAMSAVLTAISEVRQDGLTVGISGMDEFDIQDFASEIQDAQNLLKLGIPSATLKEQLFKRIAFKYFSDSRQEIKSRIADEIDAALTMEKPEIKEG